MINEIADTTGATIPVVATTEDDLMKIDTFSWVSGNNWSQTMFSSSARAAASMVGAFKHEAFGGVTKVHVVQAENGKWFVEMES